MNRNGRLIIAGATVVIVGAVIAAVTLSLSSGTGTAQSSVVVTRQDPAGQTTQEYSSVADALGAASAIAGFDVVAPQDLPANAALTEVAVGPALGPSGFRTVTVKVRFGSAGFSLIEANQLFDFDLASFHELDSPVSGAKFYKFADERTTEYVLMGANRGFSLNLLAGAPFSDSDASTVMGSLRVD